VAVDAPTIRALLFSHRVLSSFFHLRTIHMHPLLAGASWPVLAEPYDSALREAVEYVATRFDVVGVVASGSIVRGNPDATSDLDVVVIHGALIRQRIQKWFNGVPAELFVNPPASIRRYLRDERADARPSMAHMLATGHMVLARDPVVHDLVGEARAALDAGPGLDAAALNNVRYGVATRYEDARDRADADPETARLLLIPAVGAMLRYRVLATGAWQPRGKELLARVDELDPEAGRLARGILAGQAVDELFRLADLLADRTIGVRGFYEWESAADPVSPESD
jgi:hypothetical protein